MRILAISGSLRHGSYNTALLQAAKSLAPEGVEIVLFGSIADLPHFNPDLETANPPHAVKEFRTQIQNSDGLLIACPEYAHGIPGVLKNALDWLVGTEEIVGKTIGLINASPSWTGAKRAQESLAYTLSVISANVVAEASLSISGVSQKIDAKGEISDAGTFQALSESIGTLIHAIKTRSPKINEKS